MFLMVASANIFRRELSSYILSEAGHEVGEARTTEDLLVALRSRPPAAIVLDLQLERGDPGATVRAVRLLTDAPIIWIGEPGRAHPMLLADQPPEHLVSWPFRADELLAAVVSLLSREGIAAAEAAPHARQVGTVE